MDSEVLSRSLAKHLGETLHYTEEQTDVMAYGLFSLLQTLFSIVLVIVIGSMLGVMLESLIISFSIAILRKFSGGAHATSAKRCLILGTLISILGALLGHLAYSTLPGYALFCIGSILFIWSLYTVFKKSPVASPNKPIKSVHKQQKLRRGSLLIVLFYLACVGLLLITYNFMQLSTLAICSICIVLGMSWQVFTITDVGHKVTYNLDQVLIHISNIIKR